MQRHPTQRLCPQELKSVVVRWDQLAFKEVIVGEADLQYLQIFMELVAELVLEGWTSH